MKRTKSGASHPEPGLDTENLQLIEPDAAAIDVGSRSHWVAVNPERDQKPVREFGSFTADLHRLADWLVACGANSVGWNQRAFTGWRSSRYWKAGAWRCSWSMCTPHATCRVALRVTSKTANGCGGSIVMGYCAGVFGPRRRFVDCAPTYARAVA